jgi:hypothetical protein
LHAKAGDTSTFSLNGNQNAKWTFVGSAGTMSPATPAQGTLIQFHAPSTVPVQQVDTLQGCKVDESHGLDCQPAQIIVEVLGVSIPPGSTIDIPRTGNPTELLGGETIQYKATVTQGAQIVDLPVTWSKVDNSGLNLIDINPSSGIVTVQPQSVFQGGAFFVDITATNPIDPTVAVSAPFSIHIPTVSVQMTTKPTVGQTFEAKLNTGFNFAANVDGPQNPNNRTVSWSQNINLNPFGKPGTINVDPSAPNFPNSMTYVINNPPPNGVVTTTINACAGGSVDPSGNPVDAICDTYNLRLSAPVIPTSPQQHINSGESTPVTITGTGFGAAPILSFSNPTVTFTLGSISGPDANGVTTVQGTMTAVPIATSTVIPLTITSSLPPPSTPVNQNVIVRSVTTTPAVTPVNPTLLVAQSQQFTPSLGCRTSGGNTCTVPQTFTCSLISGPGTMSTSCLYTAPASLAAQSQVQAQACFTFGNVCTGFSINLTPATVALSPAAVSLNSGQSQQFQATVTNAPNNIQGVTWSINPAVGTITAAGLYTAPAVLSAVQTITVKACSTVDPAQCGSAAVTLVPPDFGFSVSPGTASTGGAILGNLTVSVTPIGGFAGTVTLSAVLPANIGMSATFSPATIPGSGTSVVQFPISTSTPGGSYAVTITGTSGGLAHSVQVTITVLIESITITVSAPQTALAGRSVSFTFTVGNNNFFCPDGLNIIGIPPGSNQIPFAWGGSGSATLTFTTPTTLAPDTYPLTITAACGSLTASATTSLTIAEPPPPPPPPPCTTRFCLDQK